MVEGGNPFITISVSVFWCIGMRPTPQILLRSSHLMSNSVDPVGGGTLSLMRPKYTGKHTRHGDSRDGHILSPASADRGGGISNENCKDGS